MNALKQVILNQASRIRYTVKDHAPSDIHSVLGQGELVIWSGESDRTIWNDPKVNHAFRALHDAAHIESGLGFSVPEEIELARTQAARYDGILSDLIYVEVAGQAMEYLKTGQFVKDQVSFTLNALKGMGYKV